MKFNLIIVLLGVLMFSFSIEEIITKTFEDKNIKCTYQTVSGRLNGLYVSYYSNGKKKAEGNFVNGYRNGVWSVWDEGGALKMKRDYSDSFMFKRLFPKFPRDKSIKLLNIPKQSIKYNNDGYINLIHVKESDVVWHKRVWRFMTPENNEVFFENNRLYGLLNNLIVSDSIKSYKDDEFMSESEKIDTTDKVLLGFKIKEDCFFDKARLVSEIRIIGICPVLVDNKTRDTIDSYWVYYPYVRKFLAKEKIDLNIVKHKYNTLEDIFFFRVFSGNIYNVSHVFDRKNKEQINIYSDLQSEEIEIIESEHNLWIKLSPE